METGQRLWESSSGVGNLPIGPRGFVEHNGMSRKLIPRELLQQFGGVFWLVACNQSADCCQPADNLFALITRFSVPGDPMVSMSLGQSAAIAANHQGDVIVDGGGQSQRSSENFLAKGAQKEILASHYFGYAGIVVVDDYG